MGLVHSDTATDKLYRYILFKRESLEAASNAYFQYNVLLASYTASKRAKSPTAGLLLLLLPSDISEASIDCEVYDMPIADGPADGD